MVYHILKNIVRQGHCYNYLAWATKFWVSLFVSQLISQENPSCQIVRLADFLQILLLGCRILVADCRQIFSPHCCVESVLTTSMSKKGVYYVFGVPETSEFIKPPGSYECCGLS